MSDDEHKRWSAWNQPRTWGLAAYSGTEYYLPTIVNVPARKPRLRQRLILLAAYLMWGVCLLEVGFYIGRFYEAHP